MITWLHLRLERLAERYLRSRGRVVVSRYFNGLVVGNCVATYDPEMKVYCVYPTFADHHDLIAINHSVVTNKRITVSFVSKHTDTNAGGVIRIP
jgi:hypothetical protein